MEKERGRRRDRETEIGRTRTITSYDGYSNFNIVANIPDSKFRKRLIDVVVDGYFVKQLISIRRPVLL